MSWLEIFVAAIITVGLGNILAKWIAKTTSPDKHRPDHFANGDGLQATDINRLHSTSITER